MDNSVNSLEISKASKKFKSKKKNSKDKGIKVVYIGNPMKVKTSASRFRALVQKLTGQDAELPDPAKFTDTDQDFGVGGGNQTNQDGEKTVSEEEVAVPLPGVVEMEQEQQIGRAEEEVVPLEDLEEVFTPQMLENLSGFFSPTLFI